MPAEMTDNEYAAHLSKRLMEVGNKMQAGDDRSLLFLCSGYLAGQRERINSLVKLLGDAKRMAEFGDINEDMEGRLCVVETVALLVLHSRLGRALRIVMRNAYRLITVDAYTQQ